ncbi:MAG: TonB-dependent receptor family protein [Tannerellaceae bacterium]|jgi:hypothetical protein|nr:TonB-dependent receptor family protein [Tannerellaceae bacterium]
MKIQMLFSLFICLATSGQAQQSILVVQGQVLDADGVSISGVAVVMQTMDSVFVDAVVSDADGYFHVESSVRPYRLIMQHIAYKPLYMESSKDDIGTVILEESMNELNGVTVTAERPLMRVDNGKLSYDLKAIAQNKLIDNAFDLVKELPGISSEGNSLRIIGAMGGTDMLISEKKSNMSFEQLLEYLRSLPADRVEKIELVYNPPPEWHVKGSAINVVLKKEDKYTLQGQLQGRYTSRYANSYMAGGSLFLATPNTSFDLIYNCNDESAKGRNRQYTKHTAGNRAYDVESDIRNKDESRYHNLYLSLNHDFAEKNSLDILYAGTFSPQKNGRITSANNLFSDAYSENKGDEYMHDVSLTCTAPFGLKAGGEYTRFRSASLQAMQYIRDETTVNAFAYDISQRINRANVYADMAHSLAHGWQLSYGARYDYTENTNAQSYEDRENKGEGSYDQSSVTGESIANAYAGLKKTFFDGKLQANASLTGEWYKINDYKKNALLPNVSLTYAPVTGHAVQAAYRTRRAYPSYWQRQEYTICHDEYTVAVGNPALRPARYSFVNLLYILRSKYMLRASYYKVNDFVIGQSYQSPDELKLIKKTVNTDFTTAIDFTVVIPLKFGRVFTADLTGSVFNERYKSQDWFDLSYDRNKWTGFISANNTLTLSANPLITLNVRAAYKTPSIQGIWDLDEMWSVNAGMKWEIVKGKAILNFQCNDIFESQYPVIKVRYGNQYQDMDIRYYLRNFLLGFTCSFKGYKDRQTKTVDTSRYGL